MIMSVKLKHHCLLIRIEQKFREKSIIRLSEDTEGKVSTAASHVIVIVF